MDEELIELLLLTVLFGQLEVCSRTSRNESVNWKRKTPGQTHINPHSLPNEKMKEFFEPNLHYSQSRLNRHRLNRHFTFTVSFARHQMFNK